MEFGCYAIWRIDENYKRIVKVKVQCIIEMCLTLLLFPNLKKFFYHYV